MSSTDITTRARGDLAVESAYTYTMELVAVSAATAAAASSPADLGPPLHVEDVDGDLGELADETFVLGLLAGELAPDCVPTRVRFAPVWRQEPLVDQLRVELWVQTPDGDEVHTSRAFAWGRWSRRALGHVQRLRESGRLAEDETAFSVIYGRLRHDDQPLPRVPPLQPPEVVEQSLEQMGVRDLLDGELDPRRPVLVNARMEQEILALTEQAGVNETGGGTLGKIVRLPEPLPGTQTPYVTLLTASLADPRHIGAPGSFQFSPVALAEADSIATLRGLGETVLTAFHTHGWNASCGNCNQSETCALPQCTEVSLDDYQVLESMLPSKAALMPIAGRKLGAEGRRPVLEIHAWSGGRMRPVLWQRYAD